MSLRIRRDAKDSEAGSAAIFIPLLVVVIVIVLAAVWGLAKTASLAKSIDRRSETIATSGQGINLATKSIIRLDQTNAFGDSIEASATPLVPKLDEVVLLAKSIDATASSINGTAGAINGTAKGINGTAANILNIGRSINNGVATINQYVDTTIDLARQIRGDTRNIVGQARTAMKYGACIDAGLTGSNDGHC